LLTYLFSFGEENVAFLNIWRINLNWLNKYCLFYTALRRQRILFQILYMVVRKKCNARQALWALQTNRVFALHCRNAVIHFDWRNWESLMEEIASMPCRMSCFIVVVWFGFAVLEIRYARQTCYQATAPAPSGGFW
jgi:hypothetical protein